MFHFKYFLTIILIASYFTLYANPFLTANHPPVVNNTIGDSGQVEWLIYYNIPGTTLENMYHEPKFPQSPDKIDFIQELSTPIKYNNLFGGMVRGFIKAPETGQYVFNLTGDDQSVFKLSSDLSFENLIDEASVPGWTNTSEHTKYPEQTSDTISLVAGNYYYFEAHYKEGGGGDFVRVHWKLPSNINSSDWTIIPGTQLYSLGNPVICPKKGTACDDNNPNTIDDSEDGACHCMGTPVNLPYSCIGNNGHVTALYFDSIPTNKLDSLYTDSDYPLSPDRAEILSRMQTSLANTIDEYGTRVRGYLVPPETGYYQFNITGNERARLMLSDSIETLSLIHI